MQRYQCGSEGKPKRTKNEKNTEKKDTKAIHLLTNNIFYMYFSIIADLCICTATFWFELCLYSFMIFNYSDIVDTICKYIINCPLLVSNKQIIPHQSEYNEKHISYYFVFGLFLLCNAIVSCSFMNK